MRPAQFLRDYWQKRPLLVRQAFPSFDPPLQPEDLAGLACGDGVLARLVTHDEERDHWQVRNGPLGEDDFARTGNANWTLLVQDVDKWDADVARLLQPFNFLPSWRVDDIMVSYAEDGGGVGAHVDQSDPISAARDRGADAAQFFLGDPQNWKGPSVSYAGGAAALRARNAARRA